MSAARDLTPLPDLPHSAAFAGPVRTRRPVYVDLLPPCNNACPAGEDIQGWLAAVRDKDFEKAFNILTADNPLPGVHGRVCYHPCEDVCNRIQLDSSVSMHAVERFIGDEAMRSNRALRKLTEQPTGKRVLVIGAGPSGLSAAYHLALAAYTSQELRFRVLARTDPETAERLAELAQAAVAQRWATYEEMAARGPERYPEVATTGRE